MLPYKIYQSPESAHNAAAPPFPTQQLFVLALCRICEPIAFMSIFPYSYYMILSFKITTDDRQIAIYVGMITSSFAFAEFSTGVLWGKLSDRFGRKPILLMGLAGTFLSMLVFGFAQSLPVALIGRALGGLLNGNIGVLQTTVAEIVTVQEHQPRAYSIMPFVWCLGSILGPAIGGALAQPCDNYPQIFGRSTLFDRYPFLLPNLVCAAILVIGVIIGILFLQETHVEKKHRRDLGLELGDWILRRGQKQVPSKTSTKFQDANIEEFRLLLEDDEPPDYCTREGTPCQQVSRPQSPAAIARIDLEVKVKEGLERKPGGAHGAFTTQVVLNIVAYGILAYHTMCFDTMMPMILSAPVSQQSPSLPFHFTGGLNLPTKTIGFMFALQGLYSMAAQVFLFPFTVRRFGNLRTFRFVLMVWPLLYLIVPYLVLLPKRLQLVGVYVCLLWRITAQVLAFPAHAILLTNSAPSMLVLGVINGVAASTASLMRAFGPTLSGVIYTAGLNMGYVGLAFWVSGLVSLVGAVESFWVDQAGGRMKEQEVIQTELRDDDTTLSPATFDAALIATERGGAEELKREL